MATAFKDLTASPIIQAYMRRTPKSAALAKRAQQVFPSGVTHDVRYMRPYGIYVTHAQGSRKWDVDGHEYVDYSGGHGALLLGHCPPAVTEAATRQLSRGTHHGASHELEVEWGERIKSMIPCADRVRFTSSGTEATLLALRLARAFTGRAKVLRFIGHFHGWHDHVAFGVSSHFDGTASTGVLPEIAGNMLMAPPWDIEATRRILEGDDDVAAVIIEPTGATWGQVPVAPGFLEALRQITRQRDVVLIFDEVVTGFRCGPGGLQGALGITPDLASLGKIVAGGVPGAALVGRADILNRLDHRAAASGDFEKILHHGTYNANPIACAAGIVALDMVRTTDVCRKAIDYGRGLQDALDDVFREEGVNWIAYGTYGGFHVFLNPNDIRTSRDEIESGSFDRETLCPPLAPGLIMKIRAGCLLHGVDIQPWPGGPVSAVHTDEDRHLTAEAFRQTIRMLKEEGDL